MFFDARRLTIEPGVTAARDTAGRLHVLNAVTTPDPTISWRGWGHPVGHAEKIVLPAAVGRHTLAANGSGALWIVWAAAR